MDFEYFRSLLEFNGICVSQAHENGYHMDHSADYWYGAYMTAVIVAKELFPKETKAYFSEVVKDLRAMGEREAAEDFQQWLDESIKRRH